jgi:hypothetical protein
MKNKQTDDMSACILDEKLTHELITVTKLADVTIEIADVVPVIDSASTAIRYLSLAVDETVKEYISRVSDQGVTVGYF